MITQIFCDTMKAVGRLPVRKNVVVDGRRTTLKFEPEMWKAIEEMAAHFHTDVAHILNDIQSEKFADESLSSAIRMRILTFFRERYHSCTRDQ